MGVVAAAAYHSPEDADGETDDRGDVMQQVRKLMLDELAADGIVDEIRQAAPDTGRAHLRQGAHSPPGTSTKQWLWRMISSRAILAAT